ncbi:hypothetical protein MEN41_04455 [Dolichospermum sp. ST_con]|nr:hypothetical protein [Dolichospermum sp. ST_con]MDD1419513.1 hypothetical protein [Dolichospermum sp. ST_sed1]MDD1425044.1 hypothetical protein [Dolichospermum sp. ST_sed9]MDD1431138.1 hypothetical protein [Dolichospermum sp. ST_sed6]MDD1437674.1 hypothetical protein [Dolichospermum sp. ST_sed10]MDD1439498.1 hypothetical protein [Dolichospermum sp. ST_sed3]MDD1445281.1 hypothetical protein [Dolichospermum sp. ST_sed8]MDD1457476.1 hypothetical protein [Dolichospermum sp. ST_sed7]MDD146054
MFEPDVRKCLDLEPGVCPWSQKNPRTDPTTSPISVQPNGETTNTPKPPDDPTTSPSIPFYAVILEGQATDLEDLKKRPEQALGKDWRRNELYTNMQICSDSRGLHYLVAGSGLNKSDADNLLKDAESKFLKGNYKTGTNSVPYNSNSCNKEF